MMLLRDCVAFVEMFVKLSAAYASLLIAAPSDARWLLMVSRAVAIADNVAVAAVTVPTSVAVMERPDADMVPMFTVIV